MYHLLHGHVLSQQVRHLRLLQKHLVLLSEELRFDHFLTQKYSTLSKSYCCLCKNESLLQRQINRHRIWKKGVSSFHDDIDGNDGKDGNYGTNENYGTNGKSAIEGVDETNGENGNNCTDENRNNGTDAKNELTDGKNVINGKNVIDSNKQDETEPDTSNKELDNETEFVIDGRANKQLNNASSSTRKVAGKDDRDNESDNSVAQFLTDLELSYGTGYTGYFTVCPKLGKLAMRKRRAQDRLYINSTSGMSYV